MASVSRDAAERRRSWPVRCRRISQRWYSGRVKSWKPADPSPSQYDAAVLRAESDRLYYKRLRAGDRIPRPIVVYQPRRDVPQVTFPTDYPPHRLRPRWDPNLPDSPAPSLERRYYYDGR